MMPITARVQNQADGNTVQPSSSRSVSAAAVRLRRRLSKIFQRDSSESGFFCRRAIGAGNARQQPARDLPIAANPAMPAAHIRAVARWVFLVQLHVAQQPGAGVAAFQQIVAEDPVVGKTPAQRPFEGINIVDALADERAFAEQVLVNIGNGARVRIDAELAGAHARIPRPARAGQAYRHPWLKNAVPRHDSLLAFVVARTIEWVRHGAYKLPGRIARQLGVGVQGDHVLHVRQNRCFTDDARKAIT